jgi:hypothetical protein
MNGGAMQKLLSGDLWTEIAKLAKKKPVKAAIAYVTTSAPLNLGKGDLLIVNASDAAIAAGETSAKVLRQAAKRGATLRSRPDLHAKVLLCGDTAVVGSGNLSESSKTALTEAAVISNRPDIVSPVTAFLHQLSQAGGSEPIDGAFLDRISLIEVKRHRAAFGRRKHPRPRVGDSRCWVAVLGLRDKKEAQYRSVIEAGLKTAKERRTKSTNELDYFWWAGRNALTKSARKGDRVVRVYADIKKKHFSTASAPATVLARRKKGSRTYFFVEVHENSPVEEVSFKRLLKWLGDAAFTERIGLASARLLPPSVSDALDLKWSIG